MGRVQGRRVVVILSDGIDVESALPVRYVSWIASQLQPVIYWIRLVNADVPADEENPPFGEHRSYWRNYEQHEQETRIWCAWWKRAVAASMPSAPSTK